MKRLWRWLWCCLCATSVHAWTGDDVRLLEKEYQLYQAWVLSRDYFFGTALTPDPLKALAWQLVYLSLLPASYPAKEKLLKPYKKKLSAAEIAEAMELATLFYESYELGPSLSEEELAHLYALHEDKLSFVILDGFKRIPTQELIYRQTGVVGRLLPWLGLEHSDIILRLIPSWKSDWTDPWYRSVVPLTLTEEGKFYATGLSPGRYELAIVSGGVRTIKQFTLQKGEVRGLSLIDIRSRF